MGYFRKILLLDLPKSVENALSEQFLEKNNKNTEIIIARENKIPETEIFDLIVHKKENGRCFPPAVPLLPLNLLHKVRLGDVLRQMEQMTEEPPLWIDDFSLGEYIFKPSEKLLVRRSGEEIQLTDKETDILVYLARHRSHAVGRDALLKNVWQYNEGVDTHTLETHIYRLRQKIEAQAEKPVLLTTSEEGGYRLNFE